MTALSQYQRLETFGIWHASADEQRRDVIVQLGEATLTISDQRMQALSHWSLPAVVRLNPGVEPACFAPGPEAPEVLELDDPTMIAAIEKVLAALVRRRSQPHRLRRALIAATIAIAVFGLALWLPGALIRQAVAVVPFAKRADLGEALLGDIRRTAGAPCDEVLGRRALDRLRARLLPDTTGRVVVLRQGLHLAQHLPGGIILIDRSLVETYDDPAVVAGHILAQAQAAREADPLKRLLTEAGVFATLKLLATGTLSPQVLSHHAETLLQSGTPRPSDAGLAARLAAAGLPAGPFARSIDPAGASTEALVAADPVAPDAAEEVLPDGDWVSLQGICGE